MGDGLYSLSASQHGLISREQALRQGLSPGEWRWLSQSDDWRRVYAGVYRRVGAPETWEQALMAGCLATDAIASHGAAGALWRLPEVERRLEVTIPQGRRVVLKGFEVHRTRFLQPVDRTHRSGIPVTSLARTVIDVSLDVPGLAPALVDHVLAKRKVPLALMANRLAAMGTQGRSGTRDLLQMLEERKGRKRHVDSGLQRELERIALHGYRDGLRAVFRVPGPPVQRADALPGRRVPQVDVGFEGFLPPPRGPRPPATNTTPRCPRGPATRSATLSCSATGGSSSLSPRSRSWTRCGW